MGVGVKENEMGRCDHKIWPISFIQASYNGSE